MSLARFERRRRAATGAPPPPPAEAARREGAARDVVGAKERLDAATPPMKDAVVELDIRATCSTPPTRHTAAGGRRTRRVAARRGLALALRGRRRCALSTFAASLDHVPRAARPRASPAPRSSAASARVPAARAAKRVLSERARALHRLPTRARSIAAELVAAAPPRLRRSARRAWLRTASSPRASSASTRRAADASCTSPHREWRPAAQWRQRDAVERWRIGGGIADARRPRRCPRGRARRAMSVAAGRRRRTGRAGRRGGRRRGEIAARAGGRKRSRRPKRSSVPGVIRRRRPSTRASPPHDAPPRRARRDSEQEASPLASADSEHPPRVLKILPCDARSERARASDVAAADGSPPAASARADAPTDGRARPNVVRRRACVGVPSWLARCRARAPHARRRGADGARSATPRRPTRFPRHGRRRRLGGRSTRRRPASAVPMAAGEAPEAPMGADGRVRAGARRAGPSRGAAASAAPRAGDVDAARAAVGACIARDAVARPPRTPRRRRSAAPRRAPRLKRGACRLLGAPRHRRLAATKVRAPAASAARARGARRRRASLRAQSPPPPVARPENAASHASRNRGAAGRRRRGGAMRAIERAASGDHGARGRGCAAESAALRSKRDASGSASRVARSPRRARSRDGAAARARAIELPPRAPARDSRTPPRPLLAGADAAQTSRAAGGDVSRRPARDRRRVRRARRRRHVRRRSAPGCAPQPWCRATPQRSAAAAAWRQAAPPSPVAARRASRAACGGGARASIDAAAPEPQPVRPSAATVDPFVIRRACGFVATTSRRPRAIGGDAARRVTAARVEANGAQRARGMRLGASRILARPRLAAAPRRRRRATAAHARGRSKPTAAIPRSQRRRLAIFAGAPDQPWPAGWRGRLRRRGPERPISSPLGGRKLRTRETPGPFVRRGARTALAQCDGCRFLRMTDGVRESRSS